MYVIKMEILKIIDILQVFQTPADQDGVNHSSFKCAWTNKVAEIQPESLKNKMYSIPTDHH